MTSRDRAALVAIALVAAPAALGGAYSLAAALGFAGAGAGAVGSARLVAVLASPTVWRSVAWTLATATVATALATAAAVAVAVRLQASRAGRWLAVFPLAVPHVAVALAALLLLGQSGLLSRLAFAAGLTSAPAGFPPLVYDRLGAGLVLAMAWKEFPFLALTALAVLDTRGHQLEETARTLGATAAQAFRRVTWPLLWRGLAPAVVAVFAFLVGQYEMSALLGPSDPAPLPVLTLERSVDPDLARRGEAHALGLIALAISIALVAVHRRTRQVEAAS